MHDPWEVELSPEFETLNDEDMLAEFYKRQDAYAAAEFELRSRFKAAFKVAAGDEINFIDDIHQASKQNFRTGLWEIIWCFYCGGKPGWQREHKTPLSRGGLDNDSNIVRSCRGCNQRKGRLTLEEYRKKLAEKTGAMIAFAGESSKQSDVR
ncbi:MAG: HNH endonuclease [Pseudolabrys sp.]